MSSDRISEKVRRRLKWLNLKRKVLWILTLVLISLGSLCLGCHLLLHAITSRTPLTSLGVNILATGISLISVLILCIIYNIFNPYDKEPRGLTVLSIVLGATVASFFSILIELTADLILIKLCSTGKLQSLIDTIILTPTVEELAKGISLALILALIWDELSGPVETIYYGALVGLGFSFTGNILHLTNIPHVNSIIPTGNLISYISILAMYWLLASLLHSLTTGYIGLGIGLWKNGKSISLSIFPSYLVAYLIHVLWNSLSLNLTPIPEIERELVIFSSSFILSLSSVIGVYLATAIPLLMTFYRYVRESEKRALTTLTALRNSLGLTDDLILATVKPDYRKTLLNRLPLKCRDYLRELSVTLLTLVTLIDNQHRNPKTERAETIMGLMDKAKELLVFISNCKDNTKYQH